MTTATHNGHIKEMPAVERYTIFPYKYKSTELEIKIDYTLKDYIDFYVRPKDQPFAEWIQIEGSFADWKTGKGVPSTHINFGIHKIESSIWEKNRTWYLCASKSNFNFYLLKAIGNNLEKFL